MIMYTLKIMLRYPETESDRRWYTAIFFRTKDECFDYLERNYPSNADSDCRFNFELTSPKGVLVQL